VENKKLKKKKIPFKKKIKMQNKIIFYLVYIALLFIIINGLTIDEVLNLNYGSYYCKDDICASYDDYDTVVIPNKEGKNTTYITSTCSISSIDSGFCLSKNCTADSECLSNKCIKGHCCDNKDNPIVH